MIVKRTVASGTVRYIEFFEDAFLPDDEDDKDGMFFVDSGLTYDSTPTTSISGLWHLRGETVGLCVDAAVVADTTVSNTGVVTLTDSGELVQVGWNFVSKIKTLPPEGGNPYGSAQGKALFQWNILLTGVPGQKTLSVLLVILLENPLLFLREIGS
jgi:hypothetical protein